MFYEPEKKNHGLPHDPFKALVVPRPIAWVSTVSPEGVVNLAPFSFFNAVCTAPPLVMFSTETDRLRGGGRKDTEKNIRSSGEFVLNFPTYALREAMNLTSAPVNEDEMNLAKLEKLPSRLVKPPRVAASPVHFECKLIKFVELPDASNPNHVTVTFGEIIGVHIDEKILTDGVIDYGKLDAISRLGGADYGRLLQDGVFSMDRPAVK
jgi:flavin reductase (DIM6/NTAB) family NADH-FMN oxidoreductase RutF